ncbi:helix-turn-helix domain-containing protein [Catenovulum sp. SX2]|uniref:helix-turn-helix domain-containing protein n=1 Tax=Catenovulum sp. SX2 TaxID=3398614 RepID=UPI003F862299
MLDFYKKAFISLVAMLIVCIAISAFLINKTFVHSALLPKAQSAINWSAYVESDSSRGGQSTAKLNDDQFSLDYTMHVQNGVDYPSASLAIELRNAVQQSDTIDLSSYNLLRFNVKCSPANVLTFIVFTVDEQLTTKDNYLSYRAPSSYFSCGPQWRQVEIDLTHLDLHDWWLEMFEQKLDSNNYNLNKVAKIQFGSTRQSPIGENAQVQINHLTLTGENWLYLYVLAVVLILTLFIYGFWLFKNYTKALTFELKNKILKERPVVAYQQLEITSHTEKDKQALFNYIATHYTNCELNLELVCTQTGLNRGKVNELLKDELGLTFTGYLNKVRLTEAARLLTNKVDANVAEIAFAVGYKNVSYFNKLFKEEYACTPKSFKSYMR